METKPLPNEFLEHVEVLRRLFERADGAKLQRALENNDLPAACEALGVSESDLEAMLRPGQHFAETFAGLYPDVAATLRKQKDKHTD